MVSRDTLENAGQRLDLDWVVLWNYLVVLTIDLGSDPNVRTGLTSGLISEAPKGPLQFAPVTSRGSLTGQGLHHVQSGDGSR